MLSYAQLQNKPRLLQSLTGLKVGGFEALLESFERVWQAQIEAQSNQSTRRRRTGGGRTPQIKDGSDKLLFILVYCRLYPTQTVQGFLFGLGQPQAHEWVHRLTGMLNAALGSEKQLLERQPHCLEAVLNECPSLEFIIDDTERPINRPKDQDVQQQYYSGKKKTHR